MSVMILLVGEQPAPNLLPLRHYDPSRVVLVHTSFPLSQLRGRRLAGLIGDAVEHPLCEVDAYRIEAIRQVLGAYLQERGWSGNELIFNLTGGTKTMSLAAYEVAREMSASAFYYQSEDRQSLIHHYRFDRGALIAEEPLAIAETLALDDYLKLYVGRYTPSDLPKQPFEAAVYQALKTSGVTGLEVMPAVFLTELGGNVEVDMLVRHGNQVAVLEAKRKAGKEGIDQLNGVTDQRTLGTYTRKLLVSATPLDDNNLALAAAHRIDVVVLESGRESALSAADRAKLIDVITGMLGVRQ